MSDFNGFNEDVRKLFFDKLSEMDPEHQRRYITDAQYHHTMHLVANVVIATVEQVRVQLGADRAQIGHVVLAVAQRFAQGAAQDRQIRTLASDTPLLAWLDEPR